MYRNMSPDMVQQAQQRMQNMSSTEIEQMRKQMEGSDLTRETARMNSYMSGQQQYKYNAAVQLKDEGNQLLQKGYHSAAQEKYELAIDRLRDLNNPEAGQQLEKCRLNLCASHLASGGNSSCVSIASEVLAGNPTCVKALYRRGQAHASLEEWPQALRDLTKAHKLTEGQPTEQAAIADKLNTVRSKAPSGTQLAEPAEPEVAPRATATPPTTEATPPPGGDAARVAEMVKENPQMLSVAANMMNGMSDSQLEEMARASGLPADAKAMRSAMDAAKGLTPEQIDMMAKMQGSAVGQQGASSSSGGPSSTAGTGSASSSGGGGLGAGMGLTPEMMEAYMHAQNKQSSSGAADMASMAASMDPEMIRTSLKSMRAMDPNLLVSLFKQQMPNMSEDQIRKMVDQYHNMSDSQVEMAAKIAVYGNKAKVLAGKAKDALMSRTALSIAVVVLLVAVLLRAQGFI